jgi:NADH-quinone oxidoreductase subunit E
VPFTPATLDLARETIARYPVKKSAVLPLLHLAQDQDGYVTPEAIEEIADLLDLTPALVLGTCSFYTMFKRESVGKLLVSVCTNVSCLVNGGPDLLEHLQRRYAADSDVTVEEVECIAACDLAPVLQVNYEFHGPLTGEGAESLIDEYKAGRRVARTISGSPVREREAAGRVSRPATSEPSGRSS